MINWVVIVISALMAAFFLVWWRWPAFRLRSEAPKYFFLRQERRFAGVVSRPSSDPIAEGD
jgi:hypothetical protein